MSIDSTIEKIQQQGVLKIGFQRHTPPFSYSQSNGTFEPVGYSVDLFDCIINRLTDRLNLRPCQIEPIEVTSSTRLELLQKGDIDMECGSTSMTCEREKLSLFSRPIFFTAHKLLLKHPSQPFFNQPEQLMRVVGIQNSTSHHAFVKWSNHHPNYRFSGKQNIAQSFESFLHDDSVDAIVADEVILKALTLSAGMIDEELHSIPDSGENYGFMIRLQDSAFQREVNVELGQLMQTPLFMEIYNRWFNQPLLGIGYNLNMPLSPNVQAQLLL